MGAADATASFALDLGITGAADAKAGADALTLFKDKVHGAEEELGGLQKAMRLLRGDAKGNAASIEDLRKKISAQKAVVASSAAAYLKLGGTFKKSKPDTDRFGNSLDILKKQLAGSSAQLNGVMGVFGQLAEAGAAAGPVGLVAVALVAVATAGIAAATALGYYGLQAADTRRSEELQLEGLTKLRYGYNLLGGGYQIAADKASFLQQSLDEVSAKVSIGRDQVAGYETQLYRMGYRAGNLRVALEGLATSAAGGGQAGAQQFLAMAEAGRFAGVSVQKLADDAKARFGGIVARQMLSLDVQSKKLKENFNFLFSGVRIEKFLEGLNKVTALFSASTESGKALKEILTTIFSPFFDGAGDAGDAGEAFADFIKGAELAALNFLISLYPLRKWLHDTFGDESLLSKIFDLNDAIDAGSYAFYAIGGAVALSLLPLALFGGAVYGIGVGVKFLGDKLGDLATMLSDIDWKGEGLQVVRGIANGIAGGAQWVIDAISNLGHGALAAFRKVFDIHSPSRVMRLEGRNVSAGAAQGVEDGIPEVQRAVGKALPDFGGTDKPAAPVASTAPASGAVAKALLVIENLVLQSNASDPQAVADDFLPKLVAALQGAGLQMGAH